MDRYFYDHPDFYDQRVLTILLIDLSMTGYTVLTYDMIYFFKIWDTNEIGPGYDSNSQLSEVELLLFINIK